MSNRQFVACKFRPGDSRSYTYHWDGEPLAPGDEVKVADRDGDGWKKVIVVSASWANPSFPTKPILGKVEEPPLAPDDLFADGDERP
jgi:hypothetical protein